jgi:alpha-D-xyloside xylohydrolase
MPYIYAQAKHSSENGLPMMRALFVEYPDDAGSWLVDDAYLFGQDLLVAPLFENVTSRDVFLPGGKWIDYQTGKVYEKGWHHIEAGEVPAVILVRDGAVIPHIKLAQSTKEMDWSELELKVYAADKQTVSGYVCLPSDQILVKLNMKKSDNSFKLNNNPFEEKSVKFKVD